ncbi:MAG: biotin synthase BioB [Candidatus Hydrogenedentota bacterium]|nr:MAG: biotin synthase BioB [Candidatus Hydrogenedentota bacterium]
MKRRELFNSYADRVMNGERLNDREAGEILETPHEDVFRLLASANDVRRHFKGDRVDLCAIVNTKSGACTEDCAFCAQSAHHDTDAPVYPLMEKEEILKHARSAEAMGANKLCFVMSGRGVESDPELEKVCAAIAAIAQNTTLDRCASIGSLDRRQLERLKAAGLQSLHHNIETAESFFDEICSTHTYADRLMTINLAKEAGFYVCCGGIFGMGESAEQRIEMAFALRELDVDSIPMNFLNPIPGTRLEDSEPIHPLEILKTIAMFRFILPNRDMRVCGGREQNLRSLQPFLYVAGANCTVLGNYLTTQGRSFREDLEMIADLGLTTGGGGTLSIDHRTNIICDAKV